MVRRAAAVLAVATGLALALCGTAPAHPLGNFTVNHYAGIELAGDAVYVHYVLDLAEIPTFQIGRDVRSAGYGARLADLLELRLDGKRVPLVPVEHQARSRPGAGGLEVLRLDIVYRAKASGSRLRFVDRAFPQRIGWREITLTARDGAQLRSSDVPVESSSDELRSYPADLLRSPLDLRAAHARFSPGSERAAAPRIDGEVGASPARGGGFEALIARGDLSPAVVLLSLLVAAFWGAAHALTPGHGKALVAGYLVGTRGRPRHAVLLGATVTVSHTAGVFGLGLVTLLLSRFVVPEQLYPWLTLVSGLLVVGVGVAILRTRFAAVEDHHAHDHDAHGHHHADRDDAVMSKGILGVGIAAGLLPCPSALVVLLSAIALHRVGLGLALIIAFSLGLAATITAIGLVALLARRLFTRVPVDGPLVRALPAVSALVVVLAGIAITARALPGVV